MGELATQKNTYDIEAYLALENGSDIRYEYHQGEVLTMAGATLTHNEITFNITAFFKRRMSKCRTFMENVKLEVVKNSFYAYPDVMVTCDARDLDDNLIQRFPILIAEVLSKSTQSIDKITKLRKYQQIPTLRYYLLVDQYEHRVEVYTCQNPQKNIWIYQDFNDLEAELDFPELNLKLKLSEIYQGVTIIEDKEDDAATPQ